MWTVAAAGALIMLSFREGFNAADVCPSVRLSGLAPQYLSELCVPVADVAVRRQLRSASRGLLYIPRYNLSNYGRRAFSYAGPHAWKLYLLKMCGNQHL